MKISKLVCGLAIATTVISGISLKANAHQPKGAVTRESEIKPEGSARDIRGVFFLENVTKYPLVSGYAKLFV